MSERVKFNSKRLLAVFLLSAFLISTFANSAALSAFADSESEEITTEAEGAGKTIPDGDYYIVNAINQDYFLDIPGDEFLSDSTYARFWVWNYNSLMPYIEGYDCFHVEYLNNGYYKLSQMGTKFCLDYNNGSTRMGDSVYLIEDNGSTSQQWSIEKTTNGYNLRSRCSGYYLDVKNGVHESFTDAQCWEGNYSNAQKFSFIPRDPDEYPVPEGDYTISSKTDKSNFLTVSQNDVQLGNDDSVALFSFVYSTDGWYKIIEKNSGMVLELSDPAEDFLNAPNIVKLAENTEDQVMGKKQLWKIRENSDGTFSIINKASGYYLEADNSNIFIDMYSGSDNQCWIIGQSTYTIKYDMNGGSGEIADQLKTINQNLTLSETIPTKTGFTFLGWNTNKDAANAEYQAGGIYSDNSSAVLYAVWEKKTVKADAVTLDNTLIKIKKGKTVTLTATVTPSEAEDKTVYWKSSDTSVAKISENGLVTAVSAGTAIITAQTINNLSASCNVIVMTSALKNTSTISKSINFGETINIKGSATGGEAPYKFEYYFKKASAAQWSKKNVANTVVSTTIKPSSATTYNIKVVVKDSKGNIAEAYSDVLVNPESIVNTSTVSEKIALGDTINIAASATGGTEPYTYSYYFKKSSASSWNTKLENTALPSTTIKPGSVTAYNVKVKITDDDGKTAEKIFNVQVVPAPLVNSSTVTSKVTLGDTIEINGSASGGTSPYTYEYFFKQANASQWFKKDVANTVTSTTIKPGKATLYNVKVVVKDADGKTGEKIFDVTVDALPLVNTSTVSSKVVIGNNIEINGSATGGTTPYTYEYYFKQASSTKWTKKNVENTVTSTTVKPGKVTEYNIKVVIKDADGKTAEKVFTVNVEPEPLVNTSTASSKIKLGESIEINGSATGGISPYTYEYYFKQANASKWNKKDVDKTTASTTIKPGTVTVYNIKVVVTDAAGKTSEKTFDVTVEQAADPLVNNSTVSDSIELGESINITASASGGTLPYTYEYYFKQKSASKWNKKDIANTETAATVTPGTATVYNIKVVVTDAANKSAEKIFDVTVNDKPEPLVNTATVSSVITLGENIDISASATGGTLPYKYEYYFKQVTQSEWIKKNVGNTVSSTTVKPGSAVPYNVKVIVTDAKGQAAERTFHVTVNEQEDIITKYTYYFLAPDAYFKAEAGAVSEDVGVYWWIPEEVAPWPGIKAEPAPEIGENVFKIVDLPPETTYVIFNNYYQRSWADDQAWQTDDINTEGYHGDCPYDETIVTDNFNGWIYVMNNDYDILNPVGALAHDGAWFKLDHYKDYDQYYGTYDCAKK